MESEMDIQSLPKEALFSLLLQIEPEEIKTVCFSKNKKVQEICNSTYFRETYKEKYRQVDFYDRKDLTEEDFKSLIGRYSVDLSWTNVTDEDLKYLKGVSIIHLAGTKVTDDGMKYLSGASDISLSWTQVTDEGLKYLSGVSRINLRDTKVTGTENIHEPDED